MAGKEYDVMSELPCSRGKVDGMQSRKKICVAELAYHWLTGGWRIDDLLQV